MKKQIKKLSIQRETLTALQVVAGAATDGCDTSKIDTTVYHPYPSLTRPTTVINA